MCCITCHPSQCTSGSNAHSNHPSGAGLQEQGHKSAGAAIHLFITHLRFLIQSANLMEMLSLRQYLALSSLLINISQLRVDASPWNIALLSLLTIVRFVVHEGELCQFRNILDSTVVYWRCVLLSSRDCFSSMA